MADDRKRFSSDPLVDEQEELAAREAAAIGGVAGDEELDPAQRPVIEAGGGQAEGFELAESDLIRHASHGDDRPDGIIFHDAGRPEAEIEQQTGEFSEADSVSRSSKPTDED